MLRVDVEICLDHLNSDNRRRLIVEKQQVRVLEGGSLVIRADHIDNSPLRQAVIDVVRRLDEINVDIFYVVKATPINGVIQVTVTHCYTVKK